MYFDKETDLMINTTSCQMGWYGKHECKGQIEDRSFTIPGQSKDAIIPYKVCKIEFSSTIFIGSKVRVNITGSHALSLVSSHGNIEVHSPIDISGSPSRSFGMHINQNTSVGGFFKIKEDGMDVGKASLKLFIPLISCVRGSEPQITTRYRNELR